VTPRTSINVSSITKEPSMTLSLYDASIPGFIHGLRQVDHFLDKAQAHVESSGGDTATLVDARLAPDMLPLSGQIQRASDTSKLSGQRLSGVASPAMPDNERSFEDLKARIAATIDYLQTLTREQIDGNAELPVTLNFGKWTVGFSGRDYLLQFALPNFQFHVVTAYAILRHHGVPLGKLDFLGRIGTPVEA
jgi:hypothetical protein